MITIFAKGIPANSVVVDFGEQIVSGAEYMYCSHALYFNICLSLTDISFINIQLSVTIELPGEEAYHFQPRLFGKVM